jgi:hypothetical protein
MAGAGNRQEFGETLDDAEDEGMQNENGISHEARGDKKSASAGRA